LAIDQAQTLALKVERHTKTKKITKSHSYSPIEGPSKGYSSKMEKATQSKTTQPAQKQVAKKSRAKRNQNIVKCYKYGEEGHVSSNCPKRKVR
jgi:hypothetical protein